MWVVTCFGLKKYQRSRCHHLQWSKAVDETQILLYNHLTWSCWTLFECCSLHFQCISLFYLDWFWKIIIIVLGDKGSQCFSCTRGTGLLCRSLIGVCRWNPSPVLDHDQLDDATVFKSRHQKSPLYPRLAIFISIIVQHTRTKPVPCIVTWAFQSLLYL